MNVWPRPVLHGTTDYTIFLYSWTTADGVQVEIAHDTTGLALWYLRQGGTKTAITPAALAAIDSAHSDGGVEPNDDGTSRLDLPDAALATGAEWVIVGGLATGITIKPVIILLSPFDALLAERAANVTKWNGTAVATPATAGYPAVTLKVGTGTGEVNLASGKAPATIAAGDIANNAITAAAIASDAITVAKIADNAITAAKIASDAITNAKIADDAISAAKIAANALSAAKIATDALAAIADAFLDRNMATGTDSGSSSVRTVRQALRTLRNKITVAAGTLTVTKEDDSTASWTGAVTGDPTVTAVDPAGP